MLMKRRPSFVLETNAPFTVIKRHTVVVRLVFHKTQQVANVEERRPCRGVIVLAAAEGVRR